MLDLQQIKDHYPSNIQVYEEAIFKEYLQYKILQAIFESKFAPKLSFLGGTALRIIYDNIRFSEDIDLDNFGLDWSEFEGVIQKVKQSLELEGFLVEIRNVSKEAYRCYLKFPDLLHDLGLTPHQEQKILIQIDTMAQGFDYKSDLKILNKFDVFTEVKVTPIDILLSQKIYTSVNRKRPKGRDFFDITFLLSRTKPNYGFINQKLNIDSADGLKREILSRIKDYDFKELSENVAPFLLYPKDIKRVEKFREFWASVELE